MYSKFENGRQKGGRITYIRIFSFVGIFILLIACINFMNLATARASQRAKEIGIRKTIGASRKNLTLQFISESTILTAVSLLLALGLVLLLLPPFNTLTGKAISIDWWNPGTMGILLLLLCSVGFLSGSYPALFLASSPIQQVVKGNRKPSTGTTRIRRSLVIFQFVLSNLLIICTLTCYRQVNYIKDKNLGYQKENVIYIPMEGALQGQYEIFKRRALQHPRILSMSSGAELPTAISWSTGGLRWEGRDPTNRVDISVIATNYDFAETLGLELLKGRFHAPEFATDSANLVINESAAEIMNMPDPLGKGVSMWGADGQVIGLVKDFHFHSMYHPIEPLVIKLSPKDNSNIIARLSGEQTEAAIGHLQALAETLNPDYPFTYGFLDDSYATTYKSESIIATLANYFSIMAICISCLGLFGLAMFAAALRHREISIRKVLGASVINLFFLLSKEFIVLVLVSFAIAIPLAWYIARSWLAGFAYHIEFGVHVFILAGIVTIGIALLTISYEALKTALNNPVNALKTE
ncbi:MAG: FtsX-like permease family protein [Pseudomonadota bacterium]